MANDLVRWGRLDNDGSWEQNEPDTQDDNEQWDAPPDQPRRSSASFSAPRRRSAGEAARAADTDAVDAHGRGDTALAFTREGDAAELRQSPMDWGDLRTWAIIVGMCIGIFLFTAFVYFMPEGRHAQNDGPTPVPSFRGY